jgi:hypothetical protein
MAEEKEFDADAGHRKFGVDAYNAAWELLDKEGRTPEENDELVHMAHASRWHWGHFGKPENLVRGEWQVSRVYAVLGWAEPALYHARRGLEVARANGIGDFDRAYAYEAVARAYALAGDAAQRDAHVELGRKAAEDIKVPRDREFFLKELDAIPPAA